MNYPLTPLRSQIRVSLPPVSRRLPFGCQLTKFMSSLGSGPASITHFSYKSMVCFAWSCIRKSSSAEIFFSSCLGSISWLRSVLFHTLSWLLNPPVTQRLPSKLKLANSTVSVCPCSSSISTRPFSSIANSVSTLPSFYSATICLGFFTKFTPQAQHLWPWSPLIKAS